MGIKQRYIILNESVKKQVMRDIAGLPCDKRISVAIGPEPKTSAQNRYLHALIRLYANEYGYSEYAAKIMMKLYFVGGDVMELKSVAEMDKEEIAALIDAVIDVLIKDNIKFPSVDEWKKLGEVDDVSKLQKRSDTVH